MYLQWCQENSMEVQMYLDDLERTTEEHVVGRGERAHRVVVCSDRADLFKARQNVPHLYNSRQLQHELRNEIS